MSLRTGSVFPVRKKDLVVDQPQLGSWIECLLKGRLRGSSLEPPLPVSTPVLSGHVDTTALTVAAGSTWHQLRSDLLAGWGF